MNKEVLLGLISIILAVIALIKYFIKGNSQPKNALEGVGKQAIISLLLNRML